MTNKSRGYSLYITLLVSFIVVAFTVLLFLFVTLGPRVSSLMRQNAVDRIRETVQQSASGFTQYTDSLQSTMQFALSILPDDPEADDSWHEKMGFLKESMPEISAIAVFDEEGTPFYTTAGQLRGSQMEVNQEDWFLRAREREGIITYFSPPHVQSLFDSQYAYVITLSRGIRYIQEGQQRLGVLMMDIYYTQFSRLVNRVKLGDSGYAFVVGPDDSIITHPRMSQIDLNLFNEDLRPVADTIIGLSDAKKGGRDSVYVIHSLDRTRWRLVGIAFVDEISQLQTSFRRMFVVALISAALLAAGIALVLTRLIMRPLTVLGATMLKVQHGDLNATMREGGFNEIRVISDTFNDMLYQLRELMDQIVQEQEKKRLHELNALQAQINPHFLYNTLDSIIWMEERGKSQESIRMVSALAKLFRISISKGRNEITVREELEHVTNYLIIQKMRFKEKFVYTIDAKEDALPLRTVKLILQPLAENVLNHAIDETLGEQLHLKITAYTEGEDLVFTVGDDGVGIPEEKLATLLTAPSGQSGIGLRNVHERIQLTYGRRYGLHIQSAEDEGTLITIRLPKYTGGKA